MSRVFFADQGSKEQLLTTLRNTAATLRAGQAEGLEGLEEVSQPGYRYADRAHLFALMLKLEMGVCAAIDQWFEWAEQEVAGWTDITGPTDRIAYFQQVVGEVTPDREHIAVEARDEPGSHARRPGPSTTDTSEEG